LRSASLAFSLSFLAWPSGWLSPSQLFHFIQSELLAVVAASLAPTTRIARIDPASSLRVE
jgi:ABC-type lipoprotein release transport system permease subunit